MTLAGTEQRWGQAVLRELWRTYRVDSQIESPFGRTSSGMSDFRGFQLAAAELKRVRFSHSDFEKANFRGAWIEDACFFSSRFVRSSFHRVSDHGNLYSNCEFVSCQFSGAAIGYRGTKFVNCIFERCSFDKVVFIRPEFDLCVFSNCRLNNSDFMGASFSNCQFVGALKDVWFRGKFPLESDVREYGHGRDNKMENVSFAEATLSGVHFSNGCDLSSVILPDHGRYQIVDNWLEKLRKLELRSAGWSSHAAQAAKIFVQSHECHAVCQPQYVLNVDDLQEEFGSSSGKAIAECLLSG